MGVPVGGVRRPTAGAVVPASRTYISRMSAGKDNQLDWTAASIPEGERVAPSLAPRKPAAPPRKGPQTRTHVMDTLLGKSDLSAIDVTGSDPYNATGRHFRR